MLAQFLGDAIKASDSSRESLANHGEGPAATPLRAEARRSVLGETTLPKCNSIPKRFAATAINTRGRQQSADEYARQESRVWWRTRRYIRGRATSDLISRSRPPQFKRPTGPAPMEFATRARSAYPDPPEAISSSQVNKRKRPRCVGDDVSLRGTHRPQASTSVAVR